ncbi:hypothetical protein PaecuDRAFT_0742 [Paenibacillus curdlanolyticus YK9]|uniref:Phage phiEco32-like COOH-NH2 ligase-type 2 n=1 Tax=Paenibacillus curdlanolyticus YK9 TaxID=717606 RepID=E0I520_9BACL|nr:hypothetical protein [Paenibacillus curdlanolyticus]EFM12062.1 hypothetical protein PaecuDRAFT_0742 [Paenibacillus curdlanolyticus YK9]
MHEGVTMSAHVWIQDERAGSSSLVRAEDYGDKSGVQGSGSRDANAASFHAQQDAIIVLGGGATAAEDAIHPSSVWRLYALGAGGAALPERSGILRRWRRAGLLWEPPSDRAGERVGSVDGVAREMSREERMQAALALGWRIYRVSVFHLEAIAMQRSGTYELSTQQPLVASPIKELLAADPMLRRVARTAVRAVYAAGLDIADVFIALSGEGRTAALAISQPSRRDGVLAGQWQAAIRSFDAGYAAMRDHARELLIGADPEFVLLRANGRIVSADRYLGRTGGAGADALLVRNRLMYPIGELRPDPSPSPDGLAHSIRRQLARADARVKDRSLRWAAGAMPVPGVALGGHVHLSGVPLTSRLLRQLDYYLALPMAMVEPERGRARRPRYGQLGDFRQQPHGGFEYRTLPSWLASPAAAKASFALLLLCAHETWRLPYRPVLDEEAEAAFYAGDRSSLARGLDQIAADLAASSSFGTYERWIEPLLHAARRGAIWNEDADIRHQWRVGSPN